MATYYKCFGLMDDGIKKPLFNDKTFTNSTNLICCLNRANDKHNFLPYKKIIIEKTQHFSKGSRAKMWPEGQITNIIFDITDGKIPLEKIRSNIVKQRSKAPKTDKNIHYSYVEKYAITGRNSVKKLPKNIDIVDFIKRLQKLDFKYINCVLLMREVSDINTKNTQHYEQMLYNPKYLTHDTLGVIMGSLYDTHKTIRYINGCDLPITKTLLNNWIENPEKIPQKLIRFLNYNAR